MGTLVLLVRLARPAQPDRQARIPPCQDPQVQLDLPEKTAQQELLAQQGQLDLLAPQGLLEPILLLLDRRVRLVRRVQLAPQEQQGRQVQHLLLRDRLVPQGLPDRPDLLGQAQYLRTQLLH